MFLITRVPYQRVSYKIILLSYYTYIIQNRRASTGRPEAGVAAAAQGAV